MLNHFYKIYKHSIPDIFTMVRVFTNDPGGLGSVPGSSHTKDSKKARAATLLIIQHYKVRIKGKVETSRESSSAISNTLV